MYVYICMICVGVCIHQHNVYVYICMYGTCRNLLTLTLTSLGRRDDAVAGQSAPWPGHALSYSTGDDPVYDYIRPYPDNNYTIISYIMLYFTRLFHCTHSATTYYVITQSNPQLQRTTLSHKVTLNLTQISTSSNQYLRNIYILFSTSLLIQPA